MDPPVSNDDLVEIAGAPVQQIGRGRTKTCQTLGRKSSGRK